MIMNKLTKIYVVALTATIALAFGACTEEVDYTPARPVSGDCMLASFVSDGEEIILPAEGGESVFGVTVQREKNDSEATVSLTANSQNSSCFSFPQTVTFAAGQSTAAFNVTLNADEIEREEFYTYSIDLEEAAIDPYDETTLATTTGYVLKQAVWNAELGTGYFEGALGEANYATVLQASAETSGGEAWYKIAPFGYEVVFKVNSDGVVRARQQLVIVANIGYGAEYIYINVNDSYTASGYNVYDAENNCLIMAMDYTGSTSGSIGTGMVVVYLP